MRVRPLPRQTADTIRRLDHEYTLAGLSEIAGTDQTVVSRPNDDRVIASQLPNRFFCCYSGCKLVRDHTINLRAYTLALSRHVHP